MRKLIVSCLITILSAGYEIVQGNALVHDSTDKIEFVVEHASENLTVKWDTMPNKAVVFKVPHEDVAIANELPLIDEAMMQHQMSAIVEEVDKAATLLFHFKGKVLHFTQTADINCSNLQICHLGPDLTAPNLILQNNILANSAEICAKHTRFSGTIQVSEQIRFYDDAKLTLNTHILDSKLELMGNILANPHTKFYAKAEQIALSGVLPAFSEAAIYTKDVAMSKFLHALTANKSVKIHASNTFTFDSAIEFSDKSYEVSAFAIDINAPVVLTACTFDFVILDPKNLNLNAVVSKDIDSIIRLHTKQFLPKSQSFGFMPFYLIDAVSEFNLIPQHLTKNFSLNADLDFKGITHEPIGTLTAPFSGNFYGKGHKIGNLSMINSKKKYQGLFGVVTGSISRLNLQNCIVSSSTRQIIAGALVGMCYKAKISQIELDKCCVYGNGFNTIVGGMCGQFIHVLPSKGSTPKGYSVMDIKGKDIQVQAAEFGYAGGLIGDAYAITLKNIDIVTKVAHKGGLNYSIKPIGNLDNTNIPIGGVFGLGGYLGCEDIMVSSEVIGDAFSAAGGMIGLSMYSHFKSCGVNSTVCGGNNAYIGGFVGSACFGKVVKSYANSVLMENQALLELGLKPSRNMISGGFFGSSTSACFNSCTESGITILGEHAVYGLNGLFGGINKDIKCSVSYCISSRKHKSQFAFSHFTESNFISVNQASLQAEVNNIFYYQHFVPFVRYATDIKASKHLMKKISSKDALVSYTKELDLNVDILPYTVQAHTKMQLKDKSIPICSVFDWNNISTDGVYHLCADLDFLHVPYIAPPVKDFTLVGNGYSLYNVTAPKAGMFYQSDYVKLKSVNMYVSGGCKFGASVNKCVLQDIKVEAPNFPATFSGMYEQAVLMNVQNCQFSINGSIAHLLAKNVDKLVYLHNKMYTNTPCSLAFQIKHSFIEDNESIKALMQPKVIQTAFIDNYSAIDFDILGDVKNIWVLHDGAKQALSEPKLKINTKDLQANPYLIFAYSYKGKTRYTGYKYCICNDSNQINLDPSEKAVMTFATSNNGFLIKEDLYAFYRLFTSCDYTKEEIPFSLYVNRDKTRKIYNLVKEKVLSADYIKNRYFAKSFQGEKNSKVYFSEPVKFANLLIKTADHVQKSSIACNMAIEPFVPKFAIDLVDDISDSILCSKKYQDIAYDVVVSTIDSLDLIAKVLGKVTGIKEIEEAGELIATFRENLLEVSEI